MDFASVSLKFEGFPTTIQEGDCLVIDRVGCVAFSRGSQRMYFGHDNKLFFGTAVTCNSAAIGALLNLLSALTGFGFKVTRDDSLVTVYQFIRR